MKLISKKTYIEDRRWFQFYPKFDRNHTTISESHYFDPRPTIHIQLTTVLSLILIPFLGSYSWILLPFLFYGWGDMYISLPLDSGINDSEYREFGFYFYGEPRYNIDCLVIQTGREQGGIYIFMPWSLHWYRSSYLLKSDEEYHWDSDLKWEHETKGNGKNMWEDKWKDVLWKKTYPYEYTLKSGETQGRTAEIKVVEQEWRRRWLMWTPLFNRVSRRIDVSFSDEVGEQSGSWKGGTVGCSFEILFSETPREALRRMELTCKF